MTENKTDEIRKDLLRHVRHCAMTHHVKQDEVMEVLKEIVEDYADKA